MQKESSNIDRESSAARPQQEASERIEALKQPERSRVHETLLASPAWAPAPPAPASKGAGTAFTQHRIVLCDLPQVAPSALETRLAGSRCSVLQTAPSATLAQAYSEVALAAFDTIRSVLREAPRALPGAAAAADHGPAQLLAGLWGLIETAALENPAIVGQVVLVEPDIATSDLAQRLRTEQDDPWDGIVRYTTSGRWVRRFGFVDDAWTPSDLLCPFREDGVYLSPAVRSGVLVPGRFTRTSGAKIILAGRNDAAAISARRWKR